MMGILNFELNLAERCKNMLSRIRIFFLGFSQSVSNLLAIE